MAKALHGHHVHTAATWHENTAPKCAASEDSAGYMHAFMPHVGRGGEACGCVGGGGGGGRTEAAP